MIGKQLIKIVEDEELDFDTTYALLETLPFQHPRALSWLALHAKRLTWISLIQSIES
jgi:hypothetical protein